MVGCCFLMLLTQDLVQLLQLNFGQFCLEIKFLGDWSRGYKHFCVESDSLVSTSLLNNECRSYHPCFIMIQDINIKEYALQGGSLKWNHTLRFCFFFITVSADVISTQFSVLGIFPCLSKKKTSFFPLPFLSMNSLRLFFFFEECANYTSHHSKSVYLFFMY